MAEHFHDCAHVRALHEEDGCCGVAQVVGTTPADAGAVAKGVPEAVHVLWVEPRAEVRGEHQLREHLLHHRLHPHFWASWLLAAGLAITQTLAAAPVLQVDGAGQLTGAQGVQVAGGLYDVEFVDGQCPVAVLGYFGNAPQCDLFFTRFAFNTPALAFASTTTADGAADSTTTTAADAGETTESSPDGSTTSTTASGGEPADGG